MKTLRFISTLLTLLTLTTVHPQKGKTYKAWATLMNDTKVKGILYSANEEGILLMDYTLVDTVAYLDHAKIDVLKLRKKGNVGKGAWIGAISGAAIGAIIGFSSGDDPEGAILGATAEQKALGIGLGLAVPGTGIGALIGSGKKKYVLNGDSNKYLGCLQELRGNALQQN